MDNWELYSLSETTLIRELQLLDEIEAIAEEYKAEFGSVPTNISIWDPVSDVIDVDLLETLPRITGAGKDYIFSYTLEDNSGVRKLLGYQDQRWRSLVSHSGSASIVMTCNWLRSHGAKAILILGPRYFTVPHCLKAMGLKFETRYCERTSKGYSLPGNIEPTAYSGVWVTNPVYGTGVYFNPKALLELQTKWTKAGKFFILDECLASIERYSGPSLEPHPKTTIIAAPHKSVCVNAFKFAVSIFEQSQLEHFEHWSDIWLGCLPQSSHQAIKHLLMGGFRNYRDRFDAAIGSSEVEFLRLTKAVNNSEIDQKATGYFRTVYLPRLPANLGLDVGFLRKAIFATGSSFIPSIRNELDPSVGLSFRVNLAAFNAEARGGYVRLLTWLASRY